MSALRTTSRVPFLSPGRALEALAFTLVGLLIVGVAIRVDAGSPLVLTSVAVTGGLVAWMAFSVRTEIALAVYVGYLLLVDGYLKLRFDGNLPVLARDVLLYAIVAGAATRWAVEQRKLRLPPLTGWVVAWVVAVLVQLSNPENGTLQHSLFALRPHLEFVPLFFFGYLLLRTPERLRALLLLVATCAAINGAVGLIQSNLTRDQLANWGPGYAAKIYGTEVGVSGRGYVDASGTVRNRPFALGSDQGFGGSLGLIATPGVLALIAMAGARRLVLASLPLAAGVAIAVVTSQSRVAVLGTLIAVAAYLLLGTASRQRLRTVGSAALGAVVVVLAVNAVVGNTAEGIFDRYASIAPDRVVQTTVDYRRDTLAIIPDYATQFPLGAGLGTVGPGGSTPGGNGKALNGESQYTFLLIETGLPGFVAFTGLLLVMAWLIVTRLPRVPDARSRLLLGAFLAPLFALLASALLGAFSTGTPGAPYVWVTAGVVAWWLVTVPRKNASSALTMT